MGFPQTVAEKALVNCGRCCCICHKFCGTKIELHHIKQKADGGEDTFENCIPLCLDCHAEVKAYNPRHPKGKSYSESELIQHRDVWYNKVNNNSPFISIEKQTEIDKDLFLSLVKLLGKNSFMDFVQKHNFAGSSFNYSILEPMDEFCYKWNKPEYEFLDLDLESCRVNLYRWISQFSHEISINTFPCENNYGAVPNEWAYEQPERFKEVTDKIHELANEICREYANLIRLGKRKLGVCNIND